MTTSFHLGLKHKKNVKAYLDERGRKAYKKKQIGIVSNKMSKKKKTKNKPRTMNSIL